MLGKITVIEKYLNTDKSLNYTKLNLMKNYGTG